MAWSPFPYSLINSSGLKDFPLSPVDLRNSQVGVVALDSHYNNYYYCYYILLRPPYYLLLTTYYLLTHLLLLTYLNTARARVRARARARVKARVGVVGVFFLGH
jgi:hypothetical protein